MSCSCCQAVKLLVSQSTRHAEEAAEDWTKMCPCSHRFLTGEGEGRLEPQQRRFTDEVKQQCNGAATAFIKRMLSDLQNHNKWHSFPRMFNCLLDPQIAPHFAHQVPRRHRPPTGLHLHTLMSALTCIAAGGVCYGGVTRPPTSISAGDSTCTEGCGDVGR